MFCRHFAQSKSTLTLTPCPLSLSRNIWTGEGEGVATRDLVRDVPVPADIAIVDVLQALRFE